MLFSEAYNLGNVEEEDWFNPELKWDTKLFLDAILVFKNELDEFQEAKEKIKIFFDEAFRRVALAKGIDNFKRRKFALEMLQFREPFEVCLGYTNFGQRGSGIGSSFAIKIFHAIVDFIDWGLDNLEEYIGSFELFAEGVGPDRLSDMLSNILKEDLIKYTQKICKEKNIPTKRFLIQNTEFDKKLGWIHKKINLPKNPLNDQPVILVPKDFLRTTRDTDSDFMEYITHLDNELLRKQATRLITKNINKEKLRELAKENKDLFKELVKSYVRDMEKERSSYDLKNDPNLLWRFRDELEKIREKVIPIEVKEKNKEFLIRFVEEIISQFKRSIESNEGYYLLFNDDGNPREERAAQIFFWSIADSMCKKSTNSPDISPETKTGRGLIDFKFSEGYHKKILVEIKLAKNQKLYTGLERQFITYLEAENTEIGYYVVIKQLGGDNTRCIRLKDRYEKLEIEKRKKIKIIEIDSYRETKTSGSKL